MLTFNDVIDKNLVNHSHNAVYPTEIMSYYIDTTIGPQKITQYQSNNYGIITAIDIDIINTGNNIKYQTFIL